MMPRCTVLRTAVVALAVSTAACSGEEQAASSDASNFSSTKATLVELEFDAEVTGDAKAEPEDIVRDQLLYVVGILQPHRSTPQLGSVALSKLVARDAKAASDDDGIAKKTVSYHAVLPVAWGVQAFPGLPSKNAPIAETFELRLPRRSDEGARGRFFEKYRMCSGDPTSRPTDLWFDFDPARSECKLDDADIVRTTAVVKASSLNTQDRSPEYDRIWSDGVLETVAIFGIDKYEFPADDKELDSDPGIIEYNQFLSTVAREIPEVRTTPSELPKNPGARVRHAVFEGAGVRVTAMLADNKILKSNDKEFDRRYAEATADADLIVYNGHSGLGSVIRNLEAKGTVKPKQYQVVFYNACSTFSNIGRGPHQRRSAVNPDDPKGTKYLDVVANVSPALFGVNAIGTLSFWRAFKERTKTYNEIFATNSNAFGPAQAVVTGEEDNP